jgi:hypothetical protein
VLTLVEEAGVVSEYPDVPDVMVLTAQSESVCVDCVHVGEQVRTENWQYELRV